MKKGSVLAMLMCKAIHQQIMLKYMLSFQVLRIQDFEADFLSKLGRLK